MSPSGSGKCPAPRAPVCPALPTPLHPSLPFWKIQLFPEAAAPPRSVHAPPAPAAGGPSLRRTGPHPGVGCGRGPSRARASPPLVLADFSAETQVWGKLGPLWPCCNLQRARGEVCPRPWKPPAPQSPPATPRGHEFLGNGPDRHS